MVISISKFVTSFKAFCVVTPGIATRVAASPLSFEQKKTPGLPVSVAGIKLISYKAGTRGSDILAETTMILSQRREIDALKKEIFRLKSLLPDLAARLTFLEMILRTQQELDDGSELVEGKIRMMHKILLLERLESTGAAAKSRQRGPQARLQEICTVIDETSLYMTQHPRIEDVLAQPDPELRLRHLVCKLRRLKYLQQYAQNKELRIGHEHRIREYERLIESLQSEIKEKREEREKKAEESLNRILNPSIFEVFIQNPDPAERIHILHGRSEQVQQHIKVHGVGQFAQNLLDFYQSLTEMQCKAIKLMEEK